MVRSVYVFIVFILFFGGCAQKKFSVLDLDKSGVEELATMPQNPDAYLQNYQNNTVLKESQKKYIQRYYRVWKQPPSESLFEVMWPHRVYTAKKTFYGINLKPLSTHFYEKMLDEANFSHYLRASKKALSLRATNMRAFPTDAVLLKDPNSAGEGFPFDYLQNSLIAPNKPLLVSHFSKDGKWAFVFSSFTSGWVKSSDIVLIDDRDAAVWMSAKQVYIYKDKESVSDTKRFLFRLRIGMLLPLVDEDQIHFTVVVATCDDGETPKYTELKVDKNFASLSPLLFTKESITKVLSQLQRSKYGWGGMFEERDCSSTVRDFFAPFGIWLGRNSSVQARSGKVISLDGLSEAEKLKIIKEKGAPFETLLYRKGHIVLYLGVYNGKVAIFQNMWGIKTKEGEKSGRVVIGRAVYSTLDLGSSLNNYDSHAALVKNLKSMNIVTLPKE